MTESEWLACQTRPMAMFRYVQRKTTTRKLQLIGCAVCRLLQEHLTDARLQHAISALEQFADGEIAEEKFVHSRSETWQIIPENLPILPHHGYVELAAARAVSCAINPDVQLGIASAIQFVTTSVTWTTQKGNWKHVNDQMRNRISGVIHEVIGNPFQKWSRTAPWSEGGLIQPDGRTVALTDTVRGLAETIHQLQAFDRLPILADALEEAGITDIALLAHCRSEQPHIRGCWALDVVRGKT